MHSPKKCLAGLYLSVTTRRSVLFLKVVFLLLDGRYQTDVNFLILCVGMAVIVVTLLGMVAYIKCHVGPYEHSKKPDAPVSHGLQLLQSPWTFSSNLFIESFHRIFSSNRERLPIISSCEQRQCAVVNTLESNRLPG